MSRRWFILLPILALALTGVWYAHAQSAGPRFTIAASTLLRQVSTAYGERHPHVLLVEDTFTDPAPQEPMYFVHLAGHFQRGRVRADELYFSALADRRFIWGMTGYQGRGTQRHNTWTDCQRPCTGALPYHHRQEAESFEANQP